MLFCRGQFWAGGTGAEDARQSCGCTARVGKLHGPTSKIIDKISIGKRRRLCFCSRSAFICFHSFCFPVFSFCFLSLSAVFILLEARRDKADAATMTCRRRKLFFWRLAPFCCVCVCEGHLEVAPAPNSPGKDLKGEFMLALPRLKAVSGQKRPPVKSGP